MAQLASNAKACPFVNGACETGDPFAYSPNAPTLHPFHVTVVSNNLLIHLLSMLSNFFRS